LPAHDALNDAYFTALVAKKLDVPEGVKTYSKAQGDCLDEVVIGDADAGADGYVTIQEMLEDEIVASPICPICKARLVQRGALLHSKGQRYTTHYSCKRDGDMLLSLKLHRNFNDTWRAKKIIKRADEAALADYREGLERASIRRRTAKRRRSKTKRPTDESVSES
jgi:hypothetical protein